MKNLLLPLIALTSISAFASPIEVNVVGADAVRLTKIIRGFSNSGITGMTRTSIAKTQDARFIIKCTSDVIGGVETNSSCSVTLKDGYESDRELIITESRKYKNIVSVQILKGSLQSQLSGKAYITPYQSVGTNMLVPYETAGRIAPAPILSISCDKSIESCAVQMSYKP